LTGSIYQFAYGEDFIDPKATVKVGKNQEICVFTIFFGVYTKEFV
jgi:hypothetical protein